MQLGKKASRSIISLFFQRHQQQLCNERVIQGKEKLSRKLCLRTAPHDFIIVVSSLLRTS